MVFGDTLPSVPVWEVASKFGTVLENAPFFNFVYRYRCFSSVGDQQTGQILSLGSGCDHKAVIEHELLHALGFYHEQSRTDRDDYVDIWLDQVTPGMYIFECIFDFFFLVIDHF